MSSPTSVLNVVIRVHHVSTIFSTNHLSKDRFKTQDQGGIGGRGVLLRVFDTGNNAMRAQLGIPVKLGSCHTAWVGGYAIEGHVPVREIQRLLRENPQAIGLAVPGMVVGSPGMDGPFYKGRKDPYSVLLVLPNGETSVYQKYA